MNVHMFRQVASKVIAWCSNRIDFDDPANCLRSPPLKPHGSLVECDLRFDVMADIVFEVVNARDALCGPVAEISKLRRDQGRLMVYVPGLSISDGFAEEDSEGFLDGANCPPWDTWVAFIDTMLISFVPNVFEANVEFGIATNAEECIKWLDTVDHPFVRELKTEGIIDER